MSELSADAILQVLAGHMTAKYLLVASEIGVFEALGGSSLTLETLSGQIHIPVRPLRILLDALLASGFVQRQGNHYQNTPLTVTFLSGTTSTDLRPVLRLWDKLVYPQWATLEEALRQDTRTYGLPEFTPLENEIFALGVTTLTAPSAKALVKQYDFSQHHRLLDLAGGMGLFLTVVLQQQADLEGTLFELPATAALAQKRLAGSPLASRITIVEGDLLQDPIPPDHDAVLLANVVHLFSQQTNLALLSRIRQSVPAAARLLLVDFWTDPSRTQPRFAALMAGEFQIFSGEGDVYSTQQVEEWLRQSRWQMLTQLPLSGAASLIVAQAV